MACQRVCIWQFKGFSTAKQVNGSYRGDIIAGNTVNKALEQRETGLNDSVPALSIFKKTAN